MSSNTNPELEKARANVQAALDLLHSLIVVQGVEKDEIERLLVEVQAELKSVTAQQR